MAVAQASSQAGRYGKNAQQFRTRLSQPEVRSQSLPMFEMLIGLTCLVAILLFLRRMRRNILQKAQSALSSAN
jgi:hypothetical protein